MTVLIVGDVMLDVFEEGRVERISPEAPVPVLHNPTGYDVLGGAANTARNITSLAHKASLVGLIGDDASGRRVQELTTAQGIADALITVPGWRTVVKHRFIASGQQMLRVDTEDPLPHSATLLIGDAVERLVASGSALVLSDYDKGAVTQAVARHAIESALTAAIPVVVDSKCLDPSHFAGARVIAPNHLEATRMTGLSDPVQAAEAIAAKTHGAVIITLGADGMLVYENGQTTKIHSVARDVADVTGAGDSVTAGLATALVEGATTVEAAKFATAAAAVAVEHRGTYAVTREDIAKARVSE